MKKKKGKGTYQKYLLFNQIFTRLPVFEKDEKVENYSNFHINEYNGSYFS